ncbi:putative ribonuclease H-like domain-containing protein [Tanacetum coccineum]
MALDDGAVLVKRLINKMKLVIHLESFQRNDLKPDCVMMIALKWIYKVKLDEYGDVLKNKAWGKLRQIPNGDYPDGLQIADMDRMTLKKVIGTKWVFRNKRDERSIVVKNKARLVAQGFRQEERIDYDEVFAPVAKIEVIRLFLAFASFMGFPVYQMDVKSAFPYDTIEEEVYVHQPLALFDPYSFQNKVYKVIKALYGLHQAPRSWYEALSSFLLKNGFRRGTIDKTLFIKKNKSDIMLVQVYVDDIIFGSTTQSMCTEFEDCMHKRFQMSSMVDIIKKFDFCSIKIATTPIALNKPLVKDKDGVNVDVHIYRFQVTLKLSHLNAVKRIFRYLKHQPKLRLWYPRNSPFKLEAFSDSDYRGASLDMKSTTGGCQFLGRRLISWQCKKQTIVVNSTTKAEYVVAANCRGQVLWVHNQMMDYGFNFMNTKIHIDNESTICIVKNPVYHSRTKYIEIRHHFIRDCYEKILIDVIKIHTDANVADLPTKGFNNVTYMKFDYQSALTVSPTIYTSYIDVKQIDTIVDSKAIVDSKIDTIVDSKAVVVKRRPSIRVLTFNVAVGPACPNNEAIFKTLH